MVTNINLAAPENEKKTMLTGKAALVLSILLVLLTLFVFGAVSYFKNSYSVQAAQAESDINKEKAIMSGKTYSELFDFQERLTLLDGVLGNHSYWDSFLKNFSQYIIPDVHLTGLTFNDKDKTLNIKGIASNFEVLSREIILLKSYPGADSIEFKNASESTQSGDGQSGVSFELNIKTNPSVLKK
jgi:Tfp pilus assembly protein PilN